MRIFNSQIGNLLIYEKSYNPQTIERLIHENNLDGLRVSLVFEDEIPDDYSIFYKLKFLKAISWDVVQEVPFDFLYEYKELERLHIQTFFSEIDFSKISTLKDLSLWWNSKFTKHLEHQQDLRTLGIEEFSEKDLKKLSGLTQLKKLRFSTAKCKSLGGIENLGNLEILSLGAFRSLNSLESIETLKKLRFLSMDIVPKVTDFIPIGELRSLEALELLDCKRLNTLSFVEKLKKLNQLSLLGTTVVGDKNLRPASHVKNVFYNHEDDYIGDLQGREDNDPRKTVFNFE